MKRWVFDEESPVQFIQLLVKVNDKLFFKTSISMTY